MTKAFFSLLLCMFLFSEISAQIIGPVNNRFNSIRQNSVSTIEAIGDTVWISPKLNRNIGNAFEWYTPVNADSVLGGEGILFSLDLAPDTVVAGLGTTSETPDGTVPTAFGYYFSIDGGEQWRFASFLVDPRAPDGCGSTSAGCDTTFVYGGIEYQRKRITVPEQSPPYDIEFQGNIVFSANWASGLLRSTNFGTSWERIVLPPSNAQELTPEREYFWTSCTRRSGGSCSQIENIYNPTEDNNLLGFSLLIDSENRVWFGSAGGINISENALFAPTDSISWNHIRFTGASDGLSGNWIIEIEEDPSTGRIWMTNWIAGQGQQYSLVYTEDGGNSFERVLIGQKINDVTFKNGYVFAAGDDGLFISADGGNSWIKSPQIKSNNNVIDQNAEFLAVAASKNHVWVGSTDGIASTGDFGKSWDIIRTDFPLSGGNVFLPEASSVETYAYPNPFSPTLHGNVRIKFEVGSTNNVKVRIFDLGMNLVKEYPEQSYSPGTYEVLWNGKNENGVKVANAPYIYIIESGSTRTDGKILIVD